VSRPDPISGSPKSFFSWVTLILPFVEEASVYDQINFKIGLEDLNKMNPNDPGVFYFHHIPFQTFLCPSDVEVGLVNDWYGARGNYAGSAGRGWLWMDNMDPWQCGNKLNPFDFNPPHLSKCPTNKSSLARVGTFQVNRGRKLSEVTDGTSKTVAVSEIRKVEGKDTRGTLHFSAGALYFHNYLPNDTIHADHSRYCGDGDRGADYAPCNLTGSDWAGYWTHTARSAHPGGLNSMLLDGSVRFISQNISEDLWYAVATPNGDEVPVEQL
jgi:hypothetical protein